MRIKFFIGICFFLFNNNTFGQDSTKGNISTFHVKVPFDQKNGISFYIQRENERDTMIDMVWRGIFINTNGEAYIYWTNPNLISFSFLRSHSYIPWDSVSVSSDTALINNIRKMITPSFFKIANHLGDNVLLENGKDTASYYEYQFTIMEHGYASFDKSIIVNHFSNKSKRARKKLTPIIDIFENAYKKYANHK